MSRIIGAGAPTFRVRLTYHISVTAPDKNHALAGAANAVSIASGAMLAGNVRVLTDVQEETPELLAEEARQQEEAAKQLRRGPMRS